MKKEQQTLAVASINGNDAPMAIVAFRQLEIMPGANLNFKIAAIKARRLLEREYAKARAELDRVFGAYQIALRAAQTNATTAAVGRPTNDPEVLRLSDDLNAAAVALEASAIELQIERITKADLPSDERMARELYVQMPQQSGQQNGGASGFQTDYFWALATVYEYFVES